MEMPRLKLRVWFLENLTSELKSMRREATAYDYWVEMGGKRQLKLDDKLWELWDNLERCVPQLPIYPLWDPLVLNRKTTLAQWAGALACFYPDLLGQAWKDLSLHPDLESVEIWQDETESYWSHLFSSLYSWWNLIGADLGAVDWVTDSPEKVRYITQWNEPFSSIEKLRIGEARYSFWTVSLGANQTACLEKASSALLLSAQLLAKRGGNELVPTKLQDGQLTMELQIPRADTLLLHPPQPLVPENVIEQVVKHILEEIIYEYIRSSEQLEAFLFEQANRIESFVLEGDVDVTRLNAMRDVLDELAKTREALTTYWP